jgi:hypothetical protein
MDPQIHAENSAKRYGGIAADYIDLHELMDSSKAAISTNLHRFLTHNSWFTTTIIPKVFGRRRQNSEGKWYNTKDVAEYHCLEDFRMKFIPTPQDYAEHMEFAPWINNGIDIPNRLKREKKEKQEELPVILDIPEQLGVLDGQASKTQMRRKTISHGNLD